MTPRCAIHFKAYPASFNSEGVYVRIVSRMAILLSSLVIMALGCSGGETSIPILPDTQGIQSPTQTASDYTPTRFLWDYNALYINEDATEYEIIPMRQVADHWNVLKWLEQGPCTNCFSISGITPTPKGTLQVFIEIRHPFSDPKLTGFDVRGIAMSHGTHYFPSAAHKVSNRFVGEAELVNADGYTALYNPYLWDTGPGGLQGYIQGLKATIPYPDTTLNGYKRYASDDPANTRNAFYAGDAITRIYEIFKPSGPLIVGYAVDASWVPASVDPVNDPIADFPPEANCSEPWRIDVDETPVGVGLTSSGGEVVLSIHVYDYQGKFSHAVPTIECPELFNGILYTKYKTDGDGFSTFEVTVSNDNLAPDGVYDCLIRAEDYDNDTAPEWLDLTGWQIHELGVGAQAPPMVADFQVSDADPDLPDRKVELTWEILDDSVEWYDIERLDWNWDTWSWYWHPVKSAPHPVDSWIDGNPRYCGPADPLQYRISARNDAGSSPGYTTDTGYPLPRGFQITLWCVADNASGGGAVVPWNQAATNFNDAKAFWSQYGMNLVLQNPDGFRWVDNPDYKNVNQQEAETMHESYGQIQAPDSVNVYYINSSDGDPGRAYCQAYCPGSFHNTEKVFIIMGSDSSGGAPPNDISIVLAHELGHALGHFWDNYLLDTNHNMRVDDGSSCENNNTWCTDPPPNYDPLFCDFNGQYQQEPNSWNKNPWNLMWYSAQNKGINNYDLTDGQLVYMHEWLLEHKGNYPVP